MGEIVLVYLDRLLNNPTIYSIWQHGKYSWGPVNITVDQQVSDAAHFNVNKKVSTCKVPSYEHQIEKLRDTHLCFEIFNYNITELIDFWTLEHTHMQFIVEIHIKFKESI